MNTYECMWPSHGRRSEMSQRAIAHTHTQGGIEAVVTAMGRHAENETLQEKACETLFNLTFNDENKAKIGAQVENVYEHI